MRVLPRHLCVIAACLLFCGAGLRPAEALVLDWDSAAWNPGSLVNSYDLTGDSVKDITVAITSRQANIWALDPTSGDQSPVVNQSLTGGLSPAQNSLMLAANLKTQSDITVQLSFNGVYPGAANVSFTLFDIDVTTNSDIISDIYAVASDGSHVAATITNVGSAVTLSGTGLTQTLTGNSAAANNTGNGNATISFGSTVIYDVFLTFSNTSGAPRYQDIAFGDISFSPVPEINPAVASVGSCVLAGLMVFVHRRARLKARRPQNAQA
jgi:hypothetical protein